MKLPRVVGATVFLVCLLSAACARNHPSPGELLDHAKVDAAQQARAVAVVNHLREDFNGEACPSIYYAAAGFFQSEELGDWLEDCRQMKHELGSWRSFTFESAIKCGKPELVVCLIGSAEFEKERIGVRIAVQLSADGDQLHTLSIDGRGRRWMQSPHWPYPTRRPWTDPPPKRTPKEGLAS